MREIEVRVAAGIRDRIDKYLTEHERVATRARIQKLLKGGMVTVGGERVKPSHRLRGGERIRIVVPDPEPSYMAAEHIPLDVVYEDRYLIIVNKPAGLVVHPGSGVRSGTLANALLAHCKDLSGVGGVVRPGIVHRLDKGTSGLIMVAKDDETHLALSEALKARQIKRIYDAVVWGRPDARGTIETLIGRSSRDRKRMAVRRHAGRRAVTSYRVAEAFEFASRLVVELGTGRTHQIRVHMAHIGHPVFGDPDYGGRRRKYGCMGRDEMARARLCLKMIDRQALHAGRLTFRHPHRGSVMTFEAPVPYDMESLIEALRRGPEEGGRCED
jgi:23S rRNA pseudouridine1911/1915/1917 synthase